MKAQTRENIGAIQDRTTAVGVFEDREHADRAIAELRKRGFRDDQIGVAMRHNTDDFEIDMDADAYEPGSEIGAGAATGALAGLGLGALAGLGVLAGVFPVIGPAIAGGTLGVILSNAAARAGGAGLVGALIGIGIPEEEATYYYGEFEAGRVVVTVQGGARAQEAEEILSRYYAYNIHTQGNSGRGMGMRMQAPAYGSGAIVDDAPDTARPGDVRPETTTLEVPVERDEIVVEPKS